MISSASYNICRERPTDRSDWDCQILLKNAEGSCSIGCMVREKDSWLREAEAKLGQRFRNRALLRAALTPPSVGAKGRAFERLEFLGDAVLALVLALDLYRRFPNLSPGELTRLRASLVNRHALAQAATQLGVPAMLRMGKSEEPEGRRRATILAAAFEALLPAQVGAPAPPPAAAGWRYR